MYRFICNKRYLKLIFAINGKNIQQLSRITNMTTSHLSNVMDQWQKEGIVTKERKGRETEVKITEVGKKMVEILREYGEIADFQLNSIKLQEDKNV